MHPRLTPVTSSNIEAVAYNPHASRLYVVFKNRRQYRYDGVSPDIVDQFLTAGSKGGFFNATIKDKFITTELDPASLDAELDAIQGIPTTNPPKQKPKKRRVKLSDALHAQYPFLRMVV